MRSIAAATARRAPAEVSAADDPVLADACPAVASRDDHAGICCMWPLGLTRRALLAAGHRLHVAGLLDAPEHVLGCTAAEVGALLRRRPGAPSESELTTRAVERERCDAATPPPVLGTLHPPPDPAVFPPGIRRMAAAMGAFLATMRARPTRRHRRRRDDLHRGRAVVAVNPDDAIARLEPGDVLITTTTTPAFNCVLPIAGALVTAHGGLMSHAGIAARELGIPAVLGLPDALDPHPRRRRGRGRPDRRDRHGPPACARQQRGSP